MKRTWHIQKEQGQVTLSRQLPARFDVSAVTVLPNAHPVRLASQIRQDLWRTLQNVRGFSPVIQITKVDMGLEVKAGGRILSAVSPKLAERITQVLEDPDNRTRWVRCAAHKERVQ